MKINLELQVSAWSIVIGYFDIFAGILVLEKNPLLAGFCLILGGVMLLTGIKVKLN